mgnify:CR=1 FL=1
MGYVDINVEGTALTSCSHHGYASTGFSRTGKCENRDTDLGNHHVCLDLNLSDGSNFCAQTGQNDWCEEQHPCHVDGQNACKIDTWCVCQWAFAEIVAKVGCDNVAIDCPATSMRALDRYRSDVSKYDHAIKCLQTKCDLE